MRLHVRLRVRLRVRVRVRVYACVRAEMDRRALGHSDMFSCSTVDIGAEYKNTKVAQHRQTKATEGD